MDVISPRKCTEEVGGLSPAAWKWLWGELPDKSQNHQAIQERMLRPKSQRYVRRDLVVLGRKLGMKKKDVKAGQVTS